MRLPPNLEFAISRLSAIEAFEGGPTYPLLVKPLLEKLESLKYSYDCKSLQEMATLKGLKEGLSYLPVLIETIKREGEQAREIERRNKENEDKIDREIANPELLDL
jgi:hypothetical protein